MPTAQIVFAIADNVAANYSHQRYCIINNNGEVIIKANANGEYIWGTTATILNIPAQHSVSHDYIVAQGTSDIWFYRKWNSGLAEFWGGKKVSGTGGVTAPAINFPFRLTNLLYKSASAIYSSGQKGVFILSGTGASISLIDTGVYVIKQDITYNNTTTVAFIQYNAKGTWK